MRISGATCAARAAATIEHGSGDVYLERFYRMQLETRRRLGLPPQPRRFFKLVQQKFAPSGKLDIWIANQGGKDVAGAVFIRDGDVMYFKWGARRHLDPSGVNHLLFW